MNFLNFFCFFILHQFFFTSFGKKRNHQCAPSSCGSIHNITNPFRLKHDPQHCGHHDYELSCENNITLIYFNSHKYAVQSINYDNYTIRAADVSITSDDVCSFPTASLAPSNFYTSYYYSIENRIYKIPDLPMYELMMPVSFISCVHEVINFSHFVPVAYFCGHTNGSAGDVEGQNRYSYIKIGHFNGSNLMDTCRIDVIVMTSAPSLLLDKGKVDGPVSRIHGYLLYGFELSWIPFLCGNECHDCSLFRNNTECPGYRFTRIMVLVEHVLQRLEMLKVPLQPLLLFIRRKVELQFFPTSLPFYRPYLHEMVVYHVLMLLGFILELNLVMKILIWPFVLAFLIYKFRRRHLSMFHEIEMFLQENSNLMPIRYSHSNIKKMTRGFRQKLGEGDFGSVYKGTLRSDHDVAVKILKKPKANHQDFINEIATIGRIHHVNVIKLVGYCFEGSTLALVYDFMSNGSLNEYAFGEERASLLSLEKKCEIVVGVARGIEYLHRGCNIQILHFDIKPHNILLDQNFTPKLSDFGLAKFYSTERSMVTLTATRGTIGYVAPELINRSFGRVSSKADVYSFGMLLLEMVGLKRDIVVGDDESSKYFPDWIYDCFERDTNIETGIVGESDEDDKHEKTIKRKMTIVGLWCIQMSPQDRPSMNEVLKLLEGKVEDIRIPPHPSKSPFFVRYSDSACGPESIGPTATTEDYSDEV